MQILAKGEIPVCSGAFVRKAHDWVRISRPKIGKRLAQQDILQAESVQILAKGEIPVLLITLRRGAFHMLPRIEAGDS